MKIAAVMVLAAGTSLIGLSAAQAQPAGSYRQSCREIEQRGPRLIATCRRIGGGWSETSIDLRSCGGSVSNSNGQLVCDGGGRRGGGRDDDGYGRRDRDRDYGRGDGRRGGYEEEYRRRY